MNDVVEKTLEEQEAEHEAAKRREYIAGLRELANWYEQHGEIPLPADDPVTVYAWDTKEQAAIVVRALGKCDKQLDDAFLRVTRNFAGVQIRFLFTRDRVCTKRVVGTVEVPAYTEPERHHPARTKEIVEWDCDPILAPAKKDPS